MIANQAEATVAVDPRNNGNLFSASMTFHGSVEGKFDPNVNVANVFQDHTPGIFATVTNPGFRGTWSGRIMATGGPTERSIQERSLPAADADPQTAFDAYGNLYLTYLSSAHQFGNATAGAGNALMDTGRQWAPDMWGGRILTIRRGTPTEESAFITGNTATQLTIGSNWINNPAPGDAYLIRSGVIGEPNGYVYGNAAVALISTDGGNNFQFLKFLDSGFNPKVDYPAVATGPGRNVNEQSVWFAWRANNAKIMVTGAPVTGLGQVNKNSFIGNEEASSTLFMTLPRLQVGPNGQVLVSFHDVPTAPNPTTIYVNADDDGLGPNGFRPNPATVAQTTVVMPQAPPPGSPPGMVIPAQPNRGITPQVNLAWDRSGTYVGAPNGRVYLVYTYLFGPADTDIRVSYSDDSGATWSLPKLVTADLNSQFLPSIAVDQTNGDLAVVWLDARNDPDNVKVSLFGTVSGDGGATYLPAVQIAQGQSDARNTNYPQRGFTTGGNTATTLNNLDQNWVPNYWRTNYNAQVPPTNDPAVFTQISTITGNTATELTVDHAWAPTPGSGEAYEIRNKSSLGTPGIYRFDYGDYTGLAFDHGTFYPVWPDNSNSTGDNPDGANTWLDLYTSWVGVSHGVPPGSPQMQTGVGRVALAAPSSRSSASLPDATLVQAILSVGMGGPILSSVPMPPAASALPPVAGADQKWKAFTPATPCSPMALLPHTRTSPKTLSTGATDAFFAAWASGVLDGPSLQGPLG